MLHLDQMGVEVGDTVGAGDSFMAGLISGLLDAKLAAARDATGCVGPAGPTSSRPSRGRSAISGLTVSRPGSYAPDRAEVQAMLAHPTAFDD